MAGIAKIICRGAPYAVLAPLMFSAQVGPHQAKANVAEWWERLIGSPAPVILQHPHVDTQITLACIVGAILWGVVLWWLHRREQTDKIRPATYVTPKKAIRYLADETVWGWKIRKKRIPGIVQETPIAMRLNARLEALGEFQREASREGSLVKVYGSKFGAPSSELISHTFWMNNGLDGTRLYSQADDQTEPTTWTQHPEKYGDLRMDWDGVQATWRRLDPVRRWMLRREHERQERSWREG